MTACIVSGGAAPYIAPALKVAHLLVDNIVLVGLQSLEPGDFAEVITPRLGQMLDGLGRGRMKGPECDIVRTGLARFHRQMAAVVTGHADLRGRTEHIARLARVAVVLAEMDAVRTETLGQRDAVVDDEGDLAIGAEPL